MWRVGATLAGWLLQAEKTVVTTLHITLPDDPGKVAGGADAVNPEAVAALEAALRGALASAMPKGKRGVAARADGRGNVGVVAGWLPEALKELDGIDEEIEEDGLPPVDDEARSAARRALRALAHQPLAPNVYPTPDGEISLSFKAPRTQAVVHVLFGNRGETGWLCAMPGLNAYGRYSNPAALPVDFLLSCLEAWGRSPNEH